MNRITQNIFDLNTKFLDILFNDESHTYYKGRDKLISTTTCIKQYQKPFDRKYWLPRTAKKKGVPIHMLADEWEYLKLYGITRGSLLHDYLEYRLQSKESIPLVNPDLFNHDLFILEEFKDEMSILKSQADDYIKWFKEDHVPIKLEMVLGTDYVGGMIDKIAFSKKTGLFKVMDYKTDKEIKVSNDYQNFLNQLSHLPDCNLTKYELQLSVYRCMLLRKIPDMQFDTNTIIWFNKKNSKFQKIELRYLEKEANIILNNEEK